MSDWLVSASHYCAEWISHQMRSLSLPGVGFAIMRGNDTITNIALGVADAETGATLTTEHCFRVASHSKTFTAVGILKLWDQGRLRLDDAVGKTVSGLRADLAEVTLRQLLSHTAGLMRDGDDSGHWQDRTPFLNVAELRAQLAAPGTIDPNTLFKYSNLGFGLLGLVIESVTGESYASWMQREIVQAAGLTRTFVDAPIPDEQPFASGHSGTMPMGRRVIPGRNPTHALASATGFVSTAADLARLFATLNPDAPVSVLSRASRLEMVRAIIRFTSGGNERFYGLGVMTGTVAGHRWFGHTGAFQGFRSRTAVIPDWHCTISLTCNGLDGNADAWMDSVLGILAQFENRGAPRQEVRSWCGRWWSVWGAVDLVPIGDRVLVAAPGQSSPLNDAMELEITAPDGGRIARASGMASFGERVERQRDTNGAMTRVRLGGAEYLPEDAFVAEVGRTRGGG